MKHFLLFGFFALFLLPNMAVAEVSDKTVESAQSFVMGVTDHGIGLLKNKSSNPSDLKNGFRKLLKNDFDMDYIGRFALGRYWRSMDKKQQNQYLDLFEDMIVDVYSDRFQSYNGEKIAVKSARADGKYDVLVNSTIVSSSGPKIRVDWRVREKGGRYKIIDIMVEGVSMALTQRSDFSSVIQRGGGDVDVLLDHLKAH